MCESSMYLMLTYRWIDTHLAFMNRNTVNGGIWMVLETHHHYTRIGCTFDHPINNVVCAAE
jgi:hypothetical protein